jgi:hypothetical protein
MLVVVLVLLVVLLVLDAEDLAVVLVHVVRLGICIFLVKLCAPLPLQPGQDQSSDSDP